MGLLRLSQSEESPPLHPERLRVLAPVCGSVGTQFRKAKRNENEREQRTLSTDCGFDKSSSSFYCLRRPRPVHHGRRIGGSVTEPPWGRCSERQG